MKTRQSSIWLKAFSLPACVIILALVAGCGSSTQPAAKVPKYKLNGIVISVDKSTREVTVDSEAIPGFMSAMTMPYTVKNVTELDNVKPKDKVTADIIVDPAGAYIENLSVVQAAPGSATGKP
jgi:protein SCO1/2